jgi:hemerythrin
MTVHPITRPLIGKKHALGHAQIDNDHFAIADWWMKSVLCEPVALPFHIAGIRKVMRQHFSREAALVEAAGTPFCYCHRREHNVMLELCDDAYALSAHNLRAARALVRNKLPRLMRDHINSMDQIAVLIIGAATQDRATTVAPCR